jgi:hypothetical protein
MGRDAAADGADVAAVVVESDVDAVDAAVVVDAELRTIALVVIPATRHLGPMTADVFITRTTEPTKMQCI